MLKFACSTRDSTDWLCSWETVELELVEEELVGVEPVAQGHGLQVPVVVFDNHVS